MPEFHENLLKKYCEPILHHWTKEVWEKFLPVNSYFFWNVVSNDWIFF